MKIATLPKTFQPKKAELSRLGQDYDGGYLVNLRDIESAEVLLSFGINDDISFENDALKISNKIFIDCYDASTGFRELLKRSMKQLISFNPILNIYKSIKKAFDFRNFVSNERVKFNDLFLGNFNHKNFIEIKRIFKKIDSDKVFIKMDIEGHEYRSLDSLLDYQDRLTGVVIEFHDVDLHIDRIKDFINNISLNLIHVHVNNFGGITKNDIPTSIEITFSSSDVGYNVDNLPHSLDMPNNYAEDEAKITFC